MKEYFKNMWVSYVLALVVSYMFFIVEPISMYLSNINDFWFDLVTIRPVIIIMSGTCFIFLTIINNLLYFINKKALNIFNVITFIAFLCFYIEGNYLVGKLPILSGDTIEWSNYTKECIYSILLWLIVIVASIIIIKKINIKNYLKYASYLSLAIFLMLTSSVVFYFYLTYDGPTKEKSFIAAATEKNINTYSNKDNFIILLIDAVDSTYFKKVMDENPELSGVLKDFTYYPDTMSVYPYTNESIPQILSGIEYENEESYYSYYIKAMNNSKLFELLYNNNYQVNIYETDFRYNDSNALKISNITNFKDKEVCYMNKVSYIKNQFKYILFRYLPYSLKKYSKIETMDFENSIVVKKDQLFYSETTTFNKYYENIPLEINEQNNFKFIHLDGAHLPFVFDKNLNRKTNASYVDEVEGCLTVVNNYINFLKENDIYNNSRIIIMADHGFAMNKLEHETVKGRQNPVLLIKGKNETHKKLTTSDKPISYSDLTSAYSDLINNKKSNSLFSDIDNNRTRRYLLYKYKFEKHMTEYETKDKAWETNKMYKTGREFNKSKSSK